MTVEAAVGAPVARALSDISSVRWGAAASALFAAGAAVAVAGGPGWLMWTCYLACYGAGGWRPAADALQALRRGTLDVDLLMVLAAIGAASIGQIFDGALLIVIFATSGALEDVATRRTRDSVDGLLDLAPQAAVLLGPDGSEHRVPAAGVRAGDVVLVRPGERISADGVVLSGTSDVDQASITGEPLPVAKAPGQEVFAGTLNGAGVLQVQVNRDAADSVVARIVALVAQASTTKAPAQLLIERIEQRYAVGVVAATLALFAVPLLFGADLQSTLLRAMTFMIVASPCAVVLATMPPLLAVIANAARHGVLVKSAAALQRLADTTVVALDKTGTLTTGSPRLAAVIAVAPGFGGPAVLALAAAAEYGSEHPLGRAVVAAARTQRLPLPQATGFRALAGRGVRAQVDGRTVEVLGPGAVAALPAVEEVEADGATAAVVAVDGQPVGVLALQDTLRPEAGPAVAALADLGAAPVLLTGDNGPAAGRVAAQVGITDVRAGLLPHEKVAAVDELTTAGHRVLVVGDGVNDAPAMAAAHTSFAMGRRGADLTLDTADAVTVHDDLDAVATTVALARRARRVVVANLCLAAGFITVLVVWDLFWYLPLPLGVAGHEGSTVLIALNGLRLLGNRSWLSARAGAASARSAGWRRTFRAGSPRPPR